MIFLRGRLFLCSILALLFAADACAASAQQQLQALMRPIKTYQSQFVQTTYDASGRVLSTAKGICVLKRPGHFYWQVNEPGKQRIIINGNKVWIYDVDLEQVTEQTLSKASVAMNPVMLLSGSDSEIFASNNVTVMRGAGELVFNLTPIKANQSLRWLRMTFRSGLLVSLRVANQVGQQTDFEMTDIRINKKVDEGLFKFSPPAGVDVVRPS